MRAHQDESNVLILYTGGTIGMLHSPNGYVPEPGFLTATLKAQSRFHDPSGTSLLSHTQSSERFLNWSSNWSSNPPSPHPSNPTPSNPSSPFQSRPSSPPPQVTGSDAIKDESHTFLVRSFVPEGEEKEGEEILFDDEGVRYRESRLEGLVTPPVDKGGKRIRYCILEYSPLIDSSNVDLTDWIRLATDISLNYAGFDGFLLLHGTDTMSFTASALSFLLEDLGKPVIITGAQIPISQLRNDAYENLLGALIISGTHPTLPEVGLFFNGSVFRGNRTSKTSNEGFDAFTSEGQPGCLVKVGINLEVNWGAILRPMGGKKFKAHRAMCSDVAILRVFPGITAGFIHSFLHSSSLKGVVLETFGAGNAPEREDVLNEFRIATKEKGIVIVNVTQCAKGFVSKTYSGGYALERAGVVAGGDMTTECALTKLSYLLSKPSLTLPQVRHLISIPLRGEISEPSLPPPTVNGLSRLQDLLAQAARLTPPSTADATTTAPSRSVLAAAAVGSSNEEVGGGEGKGNRSFQDSDHTTLPNPTVAPWLHQTETTTLLESALLPHLLLSLTKANDHATLAKLLDSYHSPHIHLHGHHEAQFDDDAVVGTVRNVANTTNEVGMALLHVAALNGSEGCVKVLLERGAGVHVRDALGHTPLYYAARQASVASVRLLREAGALFAGLDTDLVALGKARTEDHIREKGIEGREAKELRGVWM